MVTSKLLCLEIFPSQYLHSYYHISWVYYLILHLLKKKAKKTKTKKKTLKCTDTQLLGSKGQAMMVAKFKHTSK